jgi:hypothetical protein
MLPSSVQEVQEAFAAAKNLNAALKNLLKREGSATPEVVGFAKDFRAAAGAGKSAPRDLFIERHFPAKELYFMGAIRYAFPELIESTVGTVIEKYADDFNSTYSRSDDGVVVKDAARFKKIVKEVQEIIKSDLKAAEVPANNFMQNAVLAAIFEVDVLSEVMKVVAV